MKGFQLSNQDRFKITIGLESLVEDQQESDEIEDLDGVLFDPRYGYLKVELVDYLTDSYYNVQQRSTKELGLERCNDDSRVTIPLQRNLCVRFEERRKDGTFDSESPITLMGSQTFGTDYSYLKISVNHCDKDRLPGILGVNNAECFSLLEATEYFKGVRIVAAIDDGYIDLSSPSNFTHSIYEP